VLCFGKRLARLAVAPGCRRRGIGKELVEAVRRPGMTLQVRESNAAARALYVGLGFGRVKECQYTDGERGEVWLWQGKIGQRRSHQGFQLFELFCEVKPKTD